MQTLLCHITRRSIRAQCKRTLGEVTSMRHHLPLTVNVAIYNEMIAITLQGRVPEVSGLSNDIISKKYWLCMRVSHALLHLHTRTRTNVNLHAYTEIMQYLHMRRFVYRHILSGYFLCFPHPPIAEFLCRSGDLACISIFATI